MPVSLSVYSVIQLYSMRKTPKSLIKQNIQDDSSNDILPFIFIYLN